jgi:hypothetical protein
VDGQAGHGLERTDQSICATCAVLAQGVIARQPLDPATAEAIDSAVSDMSEISTGVVDERDRNRCPHVAELAIMERGVVDGFVGAPNADEQAHLVTIPRGIGARPGGDRREAVLVVGAHAAGMGSGRCLDAKRGAHG